MALENHSCVRLEDNSIDTCYLCYLNGYWPWNPTALESSTILRRVHQVQTTELNWGCTCALSELYSDIAETFHQGKGQSSESRVGVRKSVQNTNSQALGSYYLRAPEVTLPCLDLYPNELKMPKSFLLKRRSHNGADREDNFKDELVKKVKSTSMTDKKQQLIFSTTLPYYDQGPVLHIHPYPPSPLSPYRPYDAGRTFLFHPALQDLRHAYALPSYERPFLQSHFQDSLTRNFQPLPVIPKRESDFHPFLFKEKSEKHSERELSFSNKRDLFPLLDHDDGDYRQDPLKCEQCGKTFKTKYTLAIHMRMPSHTNARPFVCGVCGKGFRLSSTLCRHKIIHTSERPHKCHLCDKAFNRSSTLKTHIRTHSESKEYTCETCGKGFHQKGNLRNHTLIHTGEKPYKCRLCEKAFNKLSNLKFHMHVHTDNSPYRCRFCKVSFTRRCDLRSHIANVHEKV